MPDLKEIKTQYDGNKCAKCGRIIRKGWKAYMDADTSPKKIYCQPCGKQINSMKQIGKSIFESEKKPDKYYLTEIQADMRLIRDMIATFDTKITTLESLMMAKVTKKK